jgi:hypothetical protein
MSNRVGTHWKLKEERKPAPCFHCGTEPRLEGHVVCSAHHDELRCPKCAPGVALPVPAHLSRGALAAEFESGHEV